ncbi:MAG: helix-turn-helix transcriptional regulator [Myxococcales bacterium]|nr:helix-turn-helix transcriptional regulator [Myxococcales bacterium]
MPRRNKLNEVVHAAHEAALDMKAWPRLLGLLFDSVGARAGGVRIERHADGAVSQRWVGLEPAFERAYLEHYHRLDPWMPAVPRLSVGQCLPSAALVPHDELERSAFYQELARPFGLCDLVGGVLEKSAERVVTLAVMGDAGSRKFGAKEARVLEQILPHVRHAIEVEEALDARDQERAALWDVVGDAKAAVFALDARGIIVRLNARAEELLRASPCLRVISGRLVPSNPACAHRLEAARRVADSAPQAFPVCPQSPTPLCVRLVRPAPRTLDDRSGAIVLAIVTEATAAAPASLAARFGLTPAELRVAEGIGRGQAPKEIAQEQDVSWNTVRTQLGHIFRKTGVGSQRELACLVVRSTPPATGR